MPRSEAPDAWGPGGFLEVAPELQVDHGGSDLETLMLRPAHNHSPRGHPQSSGMTSVPTSFVWALEFPGGPSSVDNPVHSKASPLLSGHTQGLGRLALASCGI